MAASGAVALEARGLAKRYPGVVALADVSVAFAAGEVHALVGQNGAGKSTLVNILSGMQAPDAGEVRIGGRPVAIRSTHHAAELGIATVYQELSLLPNLTVAQNIALGREPRHRGLLDIARCRAAAEAALALIGAGNLAPDRRAGTLSIAERQLVEIAKALSRHPAVLILDEPTAALGRAEADRLFRLVDDLRRRGLTVIFVSHRFREILDHCDRATVLRNGRKVMTTALAGLTEADLTEAMIGQRQDLFSRRRQPARPAAAPLIEVAGLSFGNRVRDVSFTVARGEIVALTGLLGAGQAEIGRLLGGALRPAAGRVAVAGRLLTLQQPADAVAAGVGLLTDDRKGEGLLPNLTVRENVTLPSLGSRRARWGLVARARERVAVGAALGRFGVVARSPETPIRTLSGGNQQKALIARWHLADSEAFVLIEPTRGVDVGARAEIYRRLDGLAATGKAVVVISSDIPEVLALADRILVVRDGRIVAEIRARETDEERLNLLVQGAA